VKQCAPALRDIKKRVRAWYNAAAQWRTQDVLKRGKGVALLSDMSLASNLMLVIQKKL
jgi:hypothetical protein